MSGADRADSAAYPNEEGACADQAASSYSNRSDTPQQAPDHAQDYEYGHDGLGDGDGDDDDDDQGEEDSDEDDDQRLSIDAMTTTSSHSSRLSQSNPLLRSQQSQGGMAASTSTSTSTSTWSGFFAHSNNQAALSIIAVCCSSLSMTVANKYIVSGRDFSMNFLMLAVQSCVSAAAVHGAKSSGIIAYPDFHWDSARNWAPVSLGLVALMYSGSKALQYLSIPVYVIFKNLTIILIVRRVPDTPGAMASLMVVKLEPFVAQAYGEKIWFGGAVTPLELLSFVFMILSSVIAAGPNIVAAFSPSADELPSAKGTDTGIGYLWIAINCLVSAAYILGMRKKIKAMAFTDWQTSFYNNAISTPVLLLASIMFEGWSPSNFTLNFPSDARSHLIFAMLLSGFVAVFISFCSAWCIRVTSSTTYSMIGALNKLPVAISGMVFFHDPVTLRSVSAVTIGFAAGLLYTHAKQVANEAKKRTLAGYAPIKLTSSGVTHDESVQRVGTHSKGASAGRTGDASLSLIELPARRESALTKSPTSRPQS
ncbi:BZ3500_MvSof-1268-A1-R1_Chr1-3g01623 [Microbotryum saponariae]|uniref:GDP-mannose transporter n=1 Tax=Microbotryum saponariae TaxID=289078 RepID=A0A2X0KUH2_9BASI|nr:BZ3500_MvSof-1268-A1-R1_Chr1-3g01623 [Microbotryum saponariae]SCZ94171.1 BZ3501_MvSof-1269-A2-R1_Chr1-3g01224 [Microbotryum saponariae]